MEVEGTEVEEAVAKEVCGGGCGAGDWDWVWVRGVRGVREERVFDLGVGSVACVAILVLYI